EENHPIVSAALGEPRGSPGNSLSSPQLLVGISFTGPHLWRCDGKPSVPHIYSTHLSIEKHSIAESASISAKLCVPTNMIGGSQTHSQQQTRAERNAPYDLYPAIDTNKLVLMMVP
ncbi:hypothetical protein SFRURICE_016546, partial [Spodoptera frugiperda]